MSEHTQPRTLESDDLLPRVAAGDAGAFTALFRRWRGPIYRFALHMTGCASAAEDITQDVFLAVMREAGKYETGRSSEFAWLCGFARNHVRRRLDRQRPTVPLEDTADGDHGTGANASVDPLGQLIQSERLDALRAAVSRLPIRYREVVVLCDLQEVSYADAAQALDCAVGTIRSRLSRARALLAAKLGAADPAPRQRPRLDLVPVRSAHPRGVL